MSPELKRILDGFDHAGIDPELEPVARAFCLVAYRLVDEIPDGPEFVDTLGLLLVCRTMMVALRMESMSA